MGAAPQGHDDDVPQGEETALAAAAAAAEVAQAATAAAVDVQFTVVLAGGTSHTLAAQASDVMLVLMRGLAAVHEVPPTCTVKLFQSGQLFLEDSPVSLLNAEEPVFAVIARETNLDILLQGAGSYAGYAELLRSSGADAGDPTTRLVPSMPSILHVLEELSGQAPDLGEALRAGREGEGTLVFAGGGARDACEELLVPSLDLAPLLSAAGAPSFFGATLSVELNSDAYNRGLGVVLEQPPLLDNTVDEHGMPSYIYGFRARTTEKQQRQNAVKFHPGMAGAQLRVEGVGGWPNQRVPFTPQGWTTAGHRYHTLAITVRADGENVVRLRSVDGAVWEKSWRRHLVHGTHLPALYACRDLGGDGGPPVHYGSVSLQVHLERLSGDRPAECAIC